MAPDTTKKETTRHYMPLYKLFTSITEHESDQAFDPENRKQFLHWNVILQNPHSEEINYIIGYIHIFEGTNINSKLNWKREVLMVWSL